MVFRGEGLGSTRMELLCYWCMLVVGQPIESVLASLPSRAACLSAAEIPEVYTGQATGEHLAGTRPAYDSDANRYGTRFR